MNTTENTIKGKLPDLKQLSIEYGRMVSSICTRMIFNPHIAEEAAQEAWLEITRSLNSFRNESKISTWIYTIAYRVVVRYSRREKLYSTEQLSRYFRHDAPEHEIPDDYAEKNEYVKEQCDKCMVGILHCLDNDSRLMFIMHDVAHLSYGEISGIFEKSEAAVRKNISRSRLKLRHFLTEECYLFNPAGNCSCRMKNSVKDINLEKEFGRLRQTVNRLNFFKEAEEIMPRKNFWEKF